MNTFTHEGLVQNKLMEFKTGLILLQKQNNELLNGVDLSQACLPYISIKASGMTYRNHLPQKIKDKVEALLNTIFE